MGVNSQSGLYLIYLFEYVQYLNSIVVTVNTPNSILLQVSFGVLKDQFPDFIFCSVSYVC